MDALVNAPVVLVDALDVLQYVPVVQAPVGAVLVVVMVAVVIV